MPWIIALGISVAYNVIGEILAHNKNIPANSPLQYLQMVLGVLKQNSDEQK